MAPGAGETGDSWALPAGFEGSPHPHSCLGPLPLGFGYIVGGSFVRGGKTQGPARMVLSTHGRESCRARLRLLGSWSGRLGVLCLGFGALFSRTISHTPRGFDVPGLELVTCSPLAAARSGWPERRGRLGEAAAGAWLCGRRGEPAGPRAAGAPGPSPRALLAPEEGAREAPPASGSR